MQVSYYNKLICYIIIKFSISAYEREGDEGHIQQLGRSLKIKVYIHPMNSRDGSNQLVSLS